MLIQEIGECDVLTEGYSKAEERSEALTGT